MQKSFKTNYWLVYVEFLVHLWDYFVRNYIQVPGYYF